MTATGRAAGAEPPPDPDAPALSRAEAERYLRVLGVPQRPPGYDALAELVSAQVRRVPFENLSKLRRARAGRHGVPGLDEHLDGIERFGFGGTCYANNFHFHRLLVHLGYDAILCGAAMSRPDVHVVVLVRADGREYLVDGGYGAPFLDPLPRDLPHDLELTLGRERYVLKPRDADGCSALELYRDGVHRHGYVVSPVPRPIGHFAAVIESSYDADATFMNRITVMRFAPRHALVLQNLNLLEFDGPDSHAGRLARADLPEVLQARFGIPRAVAAEVLDGFAVPDGPWE
jgi:arylamine N-acetyltransferase